MLLSTLASSSSYTYESSFDSYEIREFLSDSIGIELKSLTSSMGVVLVPQSLDKTLTIFLFFSPKEHSYQVFQIFDNITEFTIYLINIFMYL